MSDTLLAKSLEAIRGTSDGSLRGEAIRGGSLQWKLLEPGNPATALVCYRFADSEAEVREVFTFSGERIARSLQTENGERCEGF